MSHFTVLVIGENPEQLLAPFQENNMGDCPKEYLQFYDVSDELKKEYEDEEDETKSKYPTFQLYAEEYHGYKKDLETGKYGYWENPNAKWDWWVVGGRWSNMLFLKNGSKADSAIKSAIDFDAMRIAERDEAEKEYTVAMQVIGELPVNETWDSVRDRFENIDEARAFYRNQQRVKAFNESKEVRDAIGYMASADRFLISKEEYLDNAANQAGVTYALLKDGIWYEKGQMGWWGISNDKMTQKEWNEQFWKLICELPDNTRLTVVDCHI